MAGPEATVQEEQWAARMRRLRERPLPQHTLRICDDDELRERAARAEQAADGARYLAEANPDDDALARRAAEAARQRNTARSALDAASVVLTFRALPRPVLEELLTRHPPTEEQAAESAAFDPDTFPAALVAAASVDGMSESEAADLLSSWSAADANALWEAAWQVQQVSRADVGKG